MVLKIIYGFANTLRQAFHTFMLLPIGIVLSIFLILILATVAIVLLCFLLLE